MGSWVWRKCHPLAPRRKGPRRIPALVEFTLIKRVSPEDFCHPRRAPRSKTLSSMKAPPESHQEFNSPAEMVTRATFVGVLTALTAGILLTVAGLISAEIRLAAAGLIALGLSAAGRAWLRHRADIVPVERALEAIGDQEPDESRSQYLLSLLQDWEAMEQKRGSPDFDPWALQVLRNDIRKVVESDPALSQLFAELQRAA
jgi:hypothetical protein